MVPLPAPWRPCFPLILVQLFLWFKRDWFTSVQESVTFSLNPSPCIVDSRAFGIPSRNHLVVTLDPAETDRHRQAFSTQGAQVGQHKPAMLGIMEALQSLSACLGAGSFALRSSVLSFVQPAVYSATPPPGLYCEPFIPRPAGHSGKLGTCELAPPFPPQGIRSSGFSSPTYMRLGNAWLTPAERRHRISLLQVLFRGSLRQTFPTKFYKIPRGCWL